ncbi:MAG: hypothetical protein AAGF10_05820, partial [Verrucomicrobiota bacterium]
LYMNYMIQTRNALFSPAGMDEEPFAENKWRNAILVIITVAFSEIRERNRAHAAQHDLLRTGLAINAYADDQGQLQPSLEALVPAYLTELPIDRLDVSASTLSYTVKGDSFRLWSVGPNGTDEGGTWHVWSLDEGDLVFRGRRAVWDEEVYD